MTTERVSSENWSNAFRQGVPARETVARAAEEASFSLLYDEALAIGSDDGLNPDVGGEDSSHDLLSGWETLLSQPGTAAIQTPATGSGLCQAGLAGQGDAGLSPVAKERPANAEVIASANADIGDTQADLSQDPGRFSKNRLIKWMDQHAHLRSLHLCAMFFRRGMEAAGASTEDRPISGEAADYGPYLLSHGAQEVPLDSYQPQAGDTAVFERSELHPAGHIEIFDGERWVSDFVQHTFSPYRDTDSTPPFKIYRLS